ncbi:hypothetical protein NDU88_004015 [Pleurodeles waltl]|uniref:Uncharacterized protein n=1 Tax=Pleurodeles waltl TaxID=8319 RepID=A0AAV7TQ83_PLEWA|nr:hypothetical protein NDU88_004015 [Pleurodeles waltl]
MTVVQGTYLASVKDNNHRKEVRYSPQILRSHKAKDQHQEPEAKDQHQEPEAKEQHQEPEAKEQHQEPEAKEQHQEPEAKEQHPEPEAKEQHPEPEAKEQHPEPEAKEQHLEPEAKEQHPEPEAKEQHPEPEAKEQHPEPEAKEQHPEPRRLSLCRQLRHSAPDQCGNPHRKEVPVRKSGGVGFRTMRDNGVGEDELILDYDEGSDEWGDELHNEVDVGVSEKRTKGREVAIKGSVGVFQ